jgi:hypothetical protein
VTRSASARPIAAGALASASTVALACGAVALAGAAQAAFVDVPPTGEPGQLVLSSDPYPAEFLDLSPGDIRYWQVAARLEGARRATLSLELRASGELVAHPRGLVMTVESCDSAWITTSGAPDCASGAQSVAVVTPADDYSSSSPTFPLSPLAEGAPEYLLVTLAIDDTPAARADMTLMGLTGDMAVGLTATAFDDRPVPPATALPATGSDPAMLAGLLATAGGMIGLGATLRLRRTGRAR